VLCQNKNKLRSECRSAGSTRYIKDKTKGTKHTSTKQKQTEKKVLQRSFEEALVPDNEESEDEE